MTPLKINYNYNQKKVFSGYLGVKVIGSLDFLFIFLCFSNYYLCNQIF